jgi:hypothetical protein
VPTSRKLSICCVSIHRAFDRDGGLTFRDRFRFTSNVVFSPLAQKSLLRPTLRRIVAKTSLWPFWRQKPSC